MVEILVRAQNNGSATTGCYNIGFAVIAVANPSHWGGEERPPKFVVVRLTDTDDTAAADKVMQMWTRKTAYEILAHDPASDFFRVRIYSTDGGASEVSKSLMNDFLISWGAERVEDTTPGVLFEITAMDAVNGTGLFTFGAEDEYMTYTETSYDPVSGVHGIHCDYANSNVSRAELERVLGEAGFYDLAIDHEMGVCDFKGDRATMIQRLERAVEHTFNTMVTRVRYRFKDDVVTQALANNGVIEMLAADVDGNTIDVATEV